MNKAFKTKKEAMAWANTQKFPTKLVKHDRGLPLGNNTYITAWKWVLYWDSKCELECNVEQCPKRLSSPPMKNYFKCCHDPIYKITT